MAETDREIVKKLAEKLGLTSIRTTYNDYGRIDILDLSNNDLTQLPPEIRHLINLEWLYLNHNKLSQLPTEVGQLANLRHLSLQSNQLTELPKEVGLLANLTGLLLDGNQLHRLPSEISQLDNLRQLSLERNFSLQSPPPEIIKQGIPAILVYLRGLLEDSVPRYEAKLLIVGEAGTGKSSLLRALRNQDFDAALSTTHGIEVDSLVLPHSQKENTNITLNTWDFGGQQIYHATHQFFLTKRSMYVITWNARLGVKQGRLDYWLETIQALAPDAPVLLVATHIDERSPDINYRVLKEQYPQLVGQMRVSNVHSIGIADLRTVLPIIVMQLPIIGQPWPATWSRIEEQLLKRPEHHIPLEAYLKCCEDCGVEEDVAKGILGSYLHDLGKILYFQDDVVLSDLVVLKPNWITKAISRVLTDKGISDAHGILQHSELWRIWQTDDDGHPYQQRLYPIFLRLMERFYLSYQIEADTPGARSTRSLIPQLLPYQPPATLPSWPSSPPVRQTQIEMRYQLSIVPSGVMSWFIVRTHLYTQGEHWREGVLLTYQDHFARVELNENRKEIRLLVWGTQPHNFFTILMNTIDVILDFFSGLTVRREVPCICHWQRHSNEACPHFFSYEELKRRMEARRYEVECPRSFEEVSVPMLLYGIHSSTDPQVMQDIQTGQQRILQQVQGIGQNLNKLDIILNNQAELISKVNQQSELIGRNFTRLWNYEMKKLEAECPNTFFLLLGSGNLFNPKSWISEEYQLFLLCQHPPQPHQAGDGYKLRKTADWWLTVSPWLNHALTFLKYAVPLAGGAEKIINPNLIKTFQDQIDLLEKIIDDLPELEVFNSIGSVTLKMHFGEEQQAVGPALRALHAFLKEQDPSETWGGLHITPTPDGNILWLCSEHRKQYEAKQAAI
ncbi:MAG TPA: COR domain-containing protein [Ktedonobacteraceae bacterium]|nr:COR domain-containing protein [Ktedonobacteraceae bacterium]